MPQGKTLVLGVGNLLLSDEGFGVHVIRRLAADPRLPEGVDVLDGGTLGPRLLDAILDCSRLILVDVANMGKPPGTLARIAEDSVPHRLRMKQSAHDWGILEVLAQAELIGACPSMVLIAAEPLDIRTFQTELTPPVRDALPNAVALILAELASPPPSHA